MLQYITTNVIRRTLCHLHVLFEVRRRVVIRRTLCHLRKAKQTFEAMRVGCCPQELKYRCQTWSWMYNHVRIVHFRHWRRIFRPRSIAYNLNSNCDGSET